MKKKLFEMSQPSARRPYVQPEVEAVKFNYDSIICMSESKLKNEVPDFEEGEELTW